MKPDELRIGNLVEYDGEVVTVTGVTEENPFVNTITLDYLDYEEITPIPLTEEWLLKFGFVLNDSTKEFHFLEMRYWVKNSVMLFFNESDKESFLTGHGSMRDGKYFVSSFNWGTKSVHQLQNLYFALTNEETIVDEIKGRDIPREMCEDLLVRGFDGGLSQEDISGLAKKGISLRYDKKEHNDYDN